MEVKHVVCAVILDGGRIFATQRGYGEFKDGWEFPGGKIEVGESAEQADYSGRSAHALKRVQRMVIAV